MKAEYRIVQGRQVVVSVDGPDAASAWRSIRHYAAQYASEGPLNIQEKRGRKWVNKVVWKVAATGDGPDFPNHRFDGLREVPSRTADNTGPEPAKGE